MPQVKITLIKYHLITPYTISVLYWLWPFITYIGPESKYSGIYLTCMEKERKSKSEYKEYKE